MISTRLFERVVVGYDGSALADTALLQSIAIAAQYGGEVVAVFASKFAAPLGASIEAASPLHLAERLERHAHDRKGFGYRAAGRQ
jgi:nucleotide-binding universal stress UspA family protein